VKPETIEKHLEARRDELAVLEAEFAQAQAAYQKRKGRLQGRINVLRSMKAAAPRRSQTLVASTQAGRRNMEAARTVFARKRTATMAEVGELADIRSGTLTWTIRALEDEGVIRETGRSVRRSREYEYVPRRGRVSTALPGN
jgi:hypothetical protein